MKLLKLALILSCLCSQSAIAAIFDVDLSLLNITNMSVSRNTALGDGWQQTRSGTFIPVYTLSETTEHVVTVTLADGTAYDYGMQLDPWSQQMVPLQFTSVFLTPKPASPTSLAILGGTDVIVYIPYLLDMNSSDIFDPDRFRFTGEDDSFFDISRYSGLYRATDINGVSVEFRGDILTAISLGGTNEDFVRDRDGNLFRIGSSVVIPLPRSVWLFASGLIGLIFVSRRAA